MLPEPGGPCRQRFLFESLDPMIEASGRSAIVTAPAGRPMCGSRLTHACGRERCSFGRIRRSRPESCARGLGTVAEGMDSGVLRVRPPPRRCSCIVSPPIWWRSFRPLVRPSEESGAWAARWGRFPASVPPCGDGAGPYRLAVQIHGRSFGRVFDAWIRNASLLPSMPQAGSVAHSRPRG